MTEEEYRAQQEERERLINEYNSLINHYNNLVTELNQVQNELNVAIDNICIVNNNAVAGANHVLPKLDASVSDVDIVKNATDHVLNAIQSLKEKYIQIKNVSTSSKKLTELDDIYNRKYRFFVRLRKITLGYVIGMDSSIISSETLRKQVEKEQLKNSDYWLSYALSSLMLWFSDEKEASIRGMEKALKMDEYKAILFFMLVNLRFGRPKVAQQWYEIFVDLIDIFDVKNEFEFILQAYLHHAFSNDAEFDKKVRAQLAGMLNEMKNSVVGFDKKITDLVLQFANSYPYKTNKDYMPLYEHCLDYSLLMNNLTKAEKLFECMKYYLNIYDEDDSSADTLKENIENVLYDLVSQYDPEEYEIYKQIKYHEYVVKASGDINLAKEAYNVLFADEDKKVSLDKLMFRFAFADLNSNVDPRLRKFAITFIIKQVKAGYEVYRNDYLAKVQDKYRFKIYDIEFTGSPETENESRNIISNHYKKYRNKIVYSDKKVKLYRGLTIGSALALTLVIVIAILMKSFPLGITIPFIIFTLSTIAFTLLWIFRAKNRARAMEEQKEEAFKILHETNESLKKYRDDFKAADDKYEGLVEALNKFDMEDKL